METSLAIRLGWTCEQVRSQPDAFITELIARINASDDDADEKRERASR